MMPAADTILRGKLSKILARLWFLWAKCYRQHWLATNKTPLPTRTLMPRQKRRGMNGLPGKGHLNRGSSEQSGRRGALRYFAAGKNGCAGGPTADQAAREGITPLEVQLRTMRMLWAKANEG